MNTTPSGSRECLGVNAVFHDPAAALVVDGEVGSSRSRRGTDRLPCFRRENRSSSAAATEQAARWCLGHAGLEPWDLDAIAYSYDPAAAPQPRPDATDEGWEGLRTLYAARPRPAPGARVRPGGRAERPELRRRGCGLRGGHPRTRPAAAAPDVFAKGGDNAGRDVTEARVVSRWFG